MRCKNVETNMTKIRVYTNHTLKIVKIKIIIYSQKHSVWQNPFLFLPLFLSFLNASSAPTHTPLERTYAHPPMATHSRTHTDTLACLLWTLALQTSSSPACIHVSTSGATRGSQVSVTTGSGASWVPSCAVRSLRAVGSGEPAILAALLRAWAWS